MAGRAVPVPTAARTRDRMAPAPGAIELVSVLLGGVTMLGMVLAGLSQATERPPAGGVAIAVEAPAGAGEDGGGAADSPLRIRITNGGAAPFEGRLVARGEKDVDAAAVTVPAGGHEVVALQPGAGCGDLVTIALEGDGEAAPVGEAARDGAPLASLVVPAACQPGETP